MSSTVPQSAMGAQVIQLSLPIVHLAMLNGFFIDNRICQCEKKHFDVVNMISILPQETTHTLNQP
jgi:hypothetical protein